MHRELRMNLKLGEGGPNVTGIVDRVDEEDGDLMIIDYKSGKAPDLKYSMPVNERIVKEKFFQLKVYALLLDAQMNRLPSKLRLLFLTGPKGPEAYTLTLRPEEVLEAKQEVLDVWDKIVVACQTNDFPTKTGKLCDYCSFKPRCPAWTSESWDTLTAGKVQVKKSLTEGGSHSESWETQKAGKIEVKRVKKGPKKGDNSS